MNTTINITPEIVDQYNTYLDEVVDTDLNGKPVTRKNILDDKWSYGLVDFAAGYQMVKENYCER